jgi:2',3'-cyclic-nucleotide 2'-phosphodiesterase (5'-nucleotidase family)
MFPFDNRVAIVEMTGRDLRSIIEKQAHSKNRPAGFSGMQVFVTCDADQMSIRMVRPDGSEIDDTDTLRVMANDFLLLGGDGIFVPVMPEDGFAMVNGTPLVRDTLVTWFRSRGGRMHADDFFDADNLRWNRSDSLSPECRLSAD